MAQQTVSYMNVLSEHSAAIRACPRSEGVYQRVIDQGRVQQRKASWPSLDACSRDDFRRRMEEIINRTATSAEDHLEICSAAHTLLLLQHDILSRMPYAESRKIDKKTNVLRAARRQQLARRRLGGQFRGLAALPLPPVEKPGPTAKFFRITPSQLENLFNVPKPPILNQRFRISEPNSEVDTVYQIRSVEISSDGLRFGMQTEGSSHANLIDEDELKGILRYCIGVSSE